MGIAFWISKYLKGKSWQSFPQNKILLMAGMIFAIVFSTMPYLRYRSYYSTWMDLGYMLHPLWNTIHGQSLQMALIYGGYGSALGDHASPILWFLSWPFALFPSPLTLFALAALSVLLAAYFLYRLAKLWLPSENVPGLLVLAFLLSFPVQYGLIVDFHADVIAAGFLAGFLFYAATDKPWKALVFFLVAILCKEHISLCLIPLLCGLAYQKFQHRKFYIGLTCIAIAYFSFCMLWLIPHYNFGEASDALQTLYFQEQDEQTFSAVMRFLYMHPMLVLEKIFTSYNWRNTFLLFSPMLFIPLSRWRYVFYLSVYLFIEYYGDMYLHNHHWVGPITLMFFLILDRLRDLSPQLRQHLAWSLVIASLMFTFLCGESPLSKRYWRVREERYSMDAQSKQFDKALSYIPKEAPIIAQAHTALHLINRHDLQLFPHGLSNEKEHWIVLDTSYRESSGHIRRKAYLNQSDTVSFNQVWQRVKNGSCSTVHSDSPIFILHCPSSIH